LKTVTHPSTNQVKKQVNKSLEFVSDNTEVVQQNLCGARAEAEEHNITERRKQKLTTEKNMMQPSACSCLTACK